MLCLSIEKNLSIKGNLDSPNLNFNMYSSSNSLIAPPVVLYFEDEAMNVTAVFYYFYALRAASARQGKKEMYADAEEILIKQSTNEEHQTYSENSYSY